MGVQLCLCLSAPKTHSNLHANPSARHPEVLSMGEQQYTQTKHTTCTVLLHLLSNVILKVKLFFFQKVTYWPTVKPAAYIFYTILDL